MKKYLFRGYCLTESKWVYGSYVEQSGKHYIYLNNPTEKDIIIAHEIEPKSVGQYIGLDNNSGKVFSSDILETYSGQGCVFWDESYLEWFIIYANGDSEPIHLREHFSSSNTVGNQYEASLLI